MVPQVASHLLLVLRGLPVLQVANRRPQVLPSPQMGLLRAGHRYSAALNLSTEVGPVTDRHLPGKRLPVEEDAPTA